MEAQVTTEVNSDSVKRMLAKQKDWIVLDVRTPDEFSQGHIPGAVNIDIYQKDAFDKIGNLNKDGRYIVYCRTRNRSAVVTDFMIRNGFKTVYQMTDGIVGWNRTQR